MNQRRPAFTPTRPVAVIGGAVGDLLLSLDRLPQSGEDIEAQEGERQIGGCAFNVARALRRLQVSVINGMPVGNGPWGQACAAAMQQLGLEVILRHEQRDNGWCLALVEPDGERTFISITGCEALWSAAQLVQLALTPQTIIYANGYELVGEGGKALRHWLLSLPAQQLRVIDFGPRLAQIDESFIDALDGTHTLLTLNRDEIQLLCGSGDAVTLALRFARQHRLTLICRLDSEGAWICPPEGEAQHLPIYPVEVADSVGAGDAHCGGLLAGLACGWPLYHAVDLANQVAACVVASPGAAGAPDWPALLQRFPR